MKYERAKMLIEIRQEFQENHCPDCKDYIVCIGARGCTDFDDYLENLFLKAELQTK